MKDILARLTTGNPAPWTVEMDFNYPDHVYRVSDAEGSEVLLRETYTGDGDRINMDDGQVLALVELVNLLSEQ